MNATYRSVLAVATLYLSGCAGFGALETSSGGRSSSDDPNAGRYSMAQDAGGRTLTEAEIPDIEVVFEAPSRGGNSDYTLFGKRYRIMAAAEGYRQEGTASWYGKKFHGHTTSNGETYDMYKLSAAHTTLPLPSYVRVTNLDNGKEVVVRVNDRGPFHENRIIDMSYAAAVRLGFSDQGTASVRVEALIPDQIQEAQYWLQFGAFREEGSAQRASSEVSRTLNERASVDNSSGLYRVRIGPLPQSRAESLQREWESKGNDKPLLVRR
ncbi:MAG: septal ring lytic transglycosylase RlpA family protein [Natronospirillum sp.]